MRITVNEQDHDTEGIETVGEIRDQFKPGADLIILNGFPVTADTKLSSNDKLVLIKRGEIPSEEELDTLLTARHTPGVHEKVKQAVIGIAGAGGLGSSIAIALARTGIGQLIVADFDIVEPSNLNRQQYFVDQIGTPKVYALKENLKRINPHVKVTSCHLRVTPVNIPDIFGHVDVLVEAFDRADQKVMLIESFATSFPDRPIVSGSGMAGYESSNSIRTQKVTDKLYICGDGVTAAAPGSGLMAPRVGVAAHHQANAVLRLLLGENPAE